MRRHSAFHQLVEIAQVAPEIGHVQLLPVRQRARRQALPEPIQHKHRPAAVEQVWCRLVVLLIDAMEASLPTALSTGASAKMKQPCIYKKTQTRGGYSDRYGIEVPRE